MSFYYTYVLRSLKDNKLYIGYASNLQKKFREHQERLNKSTRNRRPWKLVYYEACLNKQSALRREGQFKTGFGRAYLKRRLKEF